MCVFASHLLELYFELLLFFWLDFLLNESHRVLKQALITLYTKIKRNYFYRSVFFAYFRHIILKIVMREKHILGCRMTVVKLLCYL